MYYEISSWFLCTYRTQHWWVFWLFSYVGNLYEITNRWRKQKKGNRRQNIQYCCQPRDINRIFTLFNVRDVRFGNSRKWWKNSIGSVFPKPNRLLPNFRTFNVNVLSISLRIPSNTREFHVCFPSILSLWYWVPWMSFMSLISHQHQNNILERWAWGSEKEEMRNK